MQTPDFSATPSEAAERLVAFLNSHGVGFDAHVDLLDGAPARDGAALGYPGLAFPRGEELAAARALRTLLLAALGDATLLGGRAMNALAAAWPWVYRFDVDGTPRPLPQQPALVAWVVGDVALVAGAGHWPRIKTCADAACGALFYDTTRAQTRRWHSFEVCGNKANVAAHRRRHPDA